MPTQEHPGAGRDHGGRAAEPDRSPKSHYYQENRYELPIGMHHVSSGRGTVAQCGGGAANEFVRRSRSASQAWSDSDRHRPRGLGNHLSLATRWSWTGKVPGCPSSNQRSKGFAVRATAGETLQLGLESVWLLPASASGRLTSGTTTQSTRGYMSGRGCCQRSARASARRPAAAQRCSCQTGARPVAHRFHRGLLLTARGLPLRFDTDREPAVIRWAGVLALGSVGPQPLTLILLLNELQAVGWPLSLAEGLTLRPA